MMDIIEIENQYYVRAQSSLADNRTRVLMQGDAFAVFDRHGDLHPIGLNEQGLFYREARHLSKSVLRLAETQLLLLSSTVRDDNALLAVDLTNQDLQLPSGETLLRGALHIYRTKFLWKNTGANVVPRRMRSAGLGRRRSVPGAPKLPRPQCPRRRIEDLLILSLFAGINPSCQDSKSLRWWELH